MLTRRTGGDPRAVELHLPAVHRREREDGDAAGVQGLPGLLQEAARGEHRLPLSRPTNEEVNQVSPD